MLGEIGEGMEGLPGGSKKSSGGVQALPGSPNREEGTEGQEFRIQQMCTLTGVGGAVEG